MKIVFYSRVPLTEKKMMYIGVPFRKYQQGFRCVNFSEISVLVSSMEPTSTYHSEKVENKGLHTVNTREGTDLSSKL